MKRICKYKMHKDNNHNKITPYFISDGGYFLDDSGQMVGITEDDKEVYIPKTLVFLTNEELITFVKSLDLTKPNEDVESDGLNEITMTLEEKEIMANEWLKERGF